MDIEKEDNNDRRADFVSLLTTHYYRINAFILGLVPNYTDAEDIMQNTTAVMWEKYDDFRPGSDFVSWAVTIAKFQVLRFRRDKTRCRLVLSDEACEMLVQDSRRMLEKSEDRFRALRDCVQQLNEKDRHFIRLKYTENNPVVRIAERLGLSIKAAYRQGLKINDLLLRCVRRTLALQEVGDG